MAHGPGVESGCGVSQNEPPGLSRKVCQEDRVLDESAGASADQGLHLPDGYRPGQTRVCDLSGSASSMLYVAFLDGKSSKRLYLGKGRS